MTQNNLPILIKASEAIITPGIKLDLIAIRPQITNRYEIVSVTWDFNPKHKNISLTEDSLMVCLNTLDIPEITVYATEIATGIVAERTFKISKQPRIGKLVHFIKNDNHYSSDNYTWDLWTYTTNKAAIPIALSGKSDFGVTGYCVNNHVIVRKLVWDNSWCNEWAEQTSSFTLDMAEENYYIIHGDNTLYTSLKDVVNKTNPRIEYAIFDENIRAHLSHEPLEGTIFELYINSHKQNHVTCTYENQHIIISNLPDIIKPSDLIVIKANQTFSPCKVVMRNYLDRFYYSGNDLGITFTPLFIQFRLWAPTAISVELLLYRNFSSLQNQPDYVFSLNQDVQSKTFHTQIHRQSFENLFYLYRLHFNDLDKNHNTVTTITYAIDPYATSLAINGSKGCLINLDSAQTIPEQWNKDKKPSIAEGSIIYEMHVRDFTISNSSNNKFPGKFLGIGESGTYIIDSKTQNKIKTGLDSLVELGITHLHLLPVFDFASVDETKPNDANNRNWGYDPRHYNVPSGIYSTNPYDPCTKIKEFRQMVYNLHKHGLRVIIDVVYNHMANTVNFDNIVPGYYFRSDNYGRFTNGSGCGNELATERPQVGKFVRDSILHWLHHYNIDGFRFDLMELIDINTMKKIVSQVHTIDPSVLIYGEPWRAADTPLMHGTYRGSQRNENFSIFNDEFRNAIRGNNNPGHGFVNGNSHNPTNCWGVIEGLKGSINTLTTNPLESINYVDAHDNYTLWDHIEKSYNFHLLPGEYRRHITQENLFDNILIRQNLLAIGIVLTAQGIPFLHGGCEILRSKRGDHNSYKSSDLINAINWQDKVKFKPIFNYVHGLITLRKKHRAFRIHDRNIIENQLSINTTYHDDKSGVIIAHFKEHANSDIWRDIVVIYNATNIDNYAVNQFLPLPQSGLWHIVVNHEHAGIETIATYNPHELPPLRSNSMMVIHS